VTNDGLRNVWREVVVAYFKVVSQKFDGKTEKYGVKPESGVLTSRYRPLSVQHVEMV
jgi:hypothetical protein